jgi:dipeptidyl aminopeptidase/acylaminoacyl peptidase
LETRSGRGVLVVQPPDGQAQRELNSDYSIKAKVGYGGGDFTVGHGDVYFVESRSGRIYRQSLFAGKANPITPAFGNTASPVLSPDGRWLLFVRSYEGQDSLEIVDSDGKFWPQKIVSGDDFYMQPAWHPDGQRIAWVTWNHPNMPWDGTVLRMAKLQNGSDRLPASSEIVTITGNDETSIFQPEFSPDGRYLAYVSDASGWWQLYLYDMEIDKHFQMTDVSAEHGSPAWVQGMRTYGFSRDGKSLYSLRNKDGFYSLWQIDVASKKEQRLILEGDYTYLYQISVGPDGIGLIASGGTIPSRIITLKPPESGFTEAPSREEVHIWRRATSEEIPSSDYSQPQEIHWRGMDGGTSYGLYYPPHNEYFTGIGKPPLIVRIHGGPTGQVQDEFNQQAQYFTTRGFSFLEVNHRGSSGYGRKYRNMLRGNWGIYDVEDAVSGAQYLVEEGKADKEKIVVLGGSAGGFTVLKALEDYPGFFKAGVCLYGISNQFTAAIETHKFEAHYSDTLLGPLPDASQVYRERSPIFYVDKIKDPIALFQGEDDKVVWRNQSDEVVETLRRQGVPHVYHVYPGEGHGFHKAETIEHFYNQVEKFLRQYVIFA